MAHHGKEGIIKVGADVAGLVTGFSVDTTADVVESTALEDSAKTYITGRSAFSGSIDFLFDETDAAQVACVVGTSLVFTLLPEGNTVGDVSISGTGLVTSMTVGVTLDGVSTRTAAFQGTGALTTGTVSA